MQDWIEDAAAILPLPAPAQPVTVLDLGSVALHPGGRPVDPSLNAEKREGLMAEESREIFEDVVPHSLSFDGRPRPCALRSDTPDGETKGGKL